MATGPAATYDLFISYAHVDNEGEHTGKVSALARAIEAEYATFRGHAMMSEKLIATGAV